MVTYHYNQIGSTTALTNENGNVIETYEYSPYGDILDGDSSLTMFLYNGKYGVASDDNGLYYMRARYYNISIKRFINQDVMLGHQDATGSLNRYAYCEGNPVSFLDPFGLDRIDTTPIHDVLYILSLAANFITTIQPEIGYPLGVAISALDGVVSCFDLGQDIVYGSIWDVISDLGSITLDVLGAVSSINANAYRTLSNNKYKTRLVRAQYDTLKRSWDRVGVKITKAGFIGFLKNTIDIIIEKIGDIIEDI